MALDFTSVDVNTQQLEVNNVINAAQSYSNSSQITNAQYLKSEQVLERQYVALGSS